jgi:alkylated DNA repair protein (DNA oxidative demethylase)
MRCDAMRCDAMRCDAMWCGAMRCDAMLCDAKVVAPVPSLLVELAAAAAERVGMHLRRCDVAVVNAYRADARLGLHVDKPSRRGHAVPVVAFSIGDDAEFVYRRSWRKGAAEHALVLRSGDVLVFGARARGIVHGMRRVVPRTGPPEVRMPFDGTRRVCVTCREH